jgi:mevalonate kinase
MASACGKVLLFGEHAVVHGVEAIAAGLPEGVSGEVTARDGQERLVVPAWNIDCASTDEARPALAYAALLRTLPKEVRGRSVTLATTLPAGAGLGSSAAMSVAIARTLLADAAIEAAESVVFEAAMAAERVFHGNPSGLDHAAAMRGGVIRYRRGTPPSVAPVTCAVPLRLIVAQVTAGADTAKMVHGVRARRDREPLAVDPLLKGIAGVVAGAIEAIGVGDQRRIGELMDINHGILAALGVSTAELDSTCHLARSEGAFGAKLTGAGGGGCIIALVDSHSASHVADALRPRCIRLLDVTLGA